MQVWIAFVMTTLWTHEVKSSRILSYNLRPCEQRKSTHKNGEVYMGSKTHSAVFRSTVFSGIHLKFWGLLLLVLRDISWIEILFQVYLRM